MIGFSAPWLLFALPLAALPILLHLVHRREPPEVAFPAVRYLDDATRDHRRRLQLHHLLLLLVRTLLVLALILAAAGMRFRGLGVGGHAPSALVLVVDNSASSGVVVDGTPLLTSLIAAAQTALRDATPDDLLWLRTADGPAIPGTRDQLRERLALLTTTTTRLDLGLAVTESRAILARHDRPGEVIVLSDGQQSAFTASAGEAPVVLIRPDGVSGRNRHIAHLSAGSQPWGPEGGVVTVSLATTDTTPVPATLAVGAGLSRDVLLVPGVPTILRMPGGQHGWTTLAVTLPPDEFRADDELAVPVHIVAPPAARWDATERFVHAALSVLIADRRVVAGEGVLVGALGAGPSVVVPPADPALLPALNRRLAARGVSWRYTNSVRGNERADSSDVLSGGVAVHARVRIEAAGAGGEVLASVAGAPWIVRSGEVILVGSRFEPAWTDLPIETSFVPLLDALIRRAIGSAILLPDLVAGGTIRLPDRTTGVTTAGAQASVEGGALWQPNQVGVYHLLAGEDTLGAVSVVLDPRESELQRAGEETIRSLWGQVTVAGLDEGPGRAFTTGGQGNLRGPLLLLALLCAFAEVGLAGRAGQRN